MSTSTETDIASKLSTTNLAVALGLVMLAGCAPAIGASVVYIPSLVSLSNNRTLAISLGFAAGALVFVSFTEIFGKSQSYFEETGLEKEKAYSMVIVTFFAGALFTSISHYVIGHCLGSNHHVPTSPAPAQNQTISEVPDEESPDDVPVGIPLEEDLKPEIRNEDIYLHKETDFADDSSWGNMVLPSCVSRCMLCIIQWSKIMQLTGFLMQYFRGAGKRF